MELLTSTHEAPQAQLPSDSNEGKMKREVMTVLHAFEP